MSSRSPTVLELEVWSSVAMGSSVDAPEAERLHHLKWCAGQSSTHSAVQFIIKGTFILFIGQGTTFPHSTVQLCILLLLLYVCVLLFIMLFDHLFTMVQDSGEVSPL